MQPSISLYHAPGACSQVCLCALEESGLDYELKIIDFARGDAATPEYLAISPLGKVPLLVIDGVSLTENAAILTYIAQLRPDAGLLPLPSSPRMTADSISGLAFFSGTLHPIVRGLFRPSRLTTGDEAGVVERSWELADKAFTYANDHIGKSGWWLGEWSIVDVYLNWALSIANSAGYPTKKFAALAEIPGKLVERAAFRRMLEIEDRLRPSLAA
jgi:glutathione S-transferase